MKFLSNIYDPYRPDARNLFTFSREAFFDKARADFEWQNHLDWVNKNIIGPPQATEFYTTEELSQRGMVGIYSYSV